MTHPQFLVRSLKLNVYARYMNVFIAIFFASAIPMPADKNALLALSLLALMVNVVLHLFALLSDRYRLVSYCLLGLDMATIVPAIYLTGFVASPFIIMLPITFNIFYYLSMSKRNTLLFGCVCIAVIVTAFVLGWHRTSGTGGWNPNDYPVFTLAVFGLQITAVAVLIHQSTYLPSPLVSEIHRQETALALTRHRAELGVSFSMITHELRNPLATIKLAVEIAKDAMERMTGEGKPMALKHLKSADAEIRRIGGMLESVLAYTREKRDRLMPEPCRARDLINQAVEFISMKHGKHGLPRFVRATDENVSVLCDRDKMHQVLVNLLDNAIAARVKDHPLVIEARVAVHPGQAVITLRDNGKGIPPDILPRLFEDFVTLRQGGTGLGLHIVKQIMEEHNGTIQLQSTQGTGTTAILKLPLAAWLRRRKR